MIACFGITVYDTKNYVTLFDSQSDPFMLSVRAISSFHQHVYVSVCMCVCVCVCVCFVTAIAVTITITVASQIPNLAHCYYLVKFQIYITVMIQGDNNVI